MVTSSGQVGLVEEVAAHRPDMKPPTRLHLGSDSGIHRKDGGIVVEVTIVAVNRKRRKQRDEKRFGSSTEEDDSEQEVARSGQPEQDVEITEKQEEAAEPQNPGHSKSLDGKLLVGGDIEAEPRSSGSRWPAPVEERIPADARRLCRDIPLSLHCAQSQPPVSVADDERSEYSHMETGTEVGGGRVKERPRSQDSFTSQRLIPGDTLARKKFGKGKLEGSEDPVSSHSHTPQCTRPAADDLCVAAMRKPGSPETRHRKSTWRRHTVVLPGQLTDLNFNDWKEPTHGATSAAEPSARLSGGAWAEGRDSGLSSLESQKAKTPALQEPAANKGSKSQNPSLPELRHYL